MIDTEVDISSLFPHHHQYTYPALPRVLDLTSKALFAGKWKRSQISMMGILTHSCRCFVGLNHGRACTALIFGCGREDRSVRSRIPRPKAVFVIVPSCTQKWPVLHWGRPALGALCSRCSCCFLGITAKGFPNVSQSLNLSHILGRMQLTSQSVLTA